MPLYDENDVNEARDALLIGIATVLHEMHPNDILGMALHIFTRAKIREWGEEETTSDEGTRQ